jgi:hypothetical protein
MIERPRLDAVQAVRIAELGSFARAAAAMQTTAAAGLKPVRLKRGLRSIERTPRYVLLGAGRSLPRTRPELLRSTSRAHGICRSLAAPIIGISDHVAGAGAPR